MNDDVQNGIIRDIRLLQTQILSNLNNINIQEEKISYALSDTNEEVKYSSQLNHSALVDPYKSKSKQYQDQQEQNQKKQQQKYQNVIDSVVVDGNKYGKKMQVVQNQFITQQSLTNKEQSRLINKYVSKSPQIAQLNVVDDILIIDQNSNLQFLYQLQQFRNDALSQLQFLNRDLECYYKCFNHILFNLKFNQLLNQLITKQRNKITLQRTFTYMKSQKDNYKQQDKSITQPFKRQSSKNSITSSSLLSNQRSPVYKNLKDQSTQLKKQYITVSTQTQEKQNDFYIPKQIQSDMLMEPSFLLPEQEKDEQIQIQLAKSIKDTQNDLNNVMITSQYRKHNIQNNDIQISNVFKNDQYNISSQEQVQALTSSRSKKQQNQILYLQKDVSGQKSNTNTSYASSYASFQQQNKHQHNLQSIKQTKSKTISKSGSKLHYTSLLIANMSQTTKFELKYKQAQEQLVKQYNKRQLKQLNSIKQSYGRFFNSLLKKKTNKKLMHQPLLARTQFLNKIEQHIEILRIYKPRKLMCLWDSKNAIFYALHRQYSANLVSGWYDEINLIWIQKVVLKNLIKYYQHLQNGNKQCIALSKSIETKKIVQISAQVFTIMRDFNFSIKKFKGKVSQHTIKLYYFIIKSYYNQLQVSYKSLSQNTQLQEGQTYKLAFFKIMNDKLKDRELKNLISDSYRNVLRKKRQLHDILETIAFPIIQNERKSLLLQGIYAFKCNYFITYRKIQLQRQVLIYIINYYQFIQQAKKQTIYISGQYLQQHIIYLLHQYHVRMHKKVHEIQAINNSILVKNSFKKLIAYTQNMHECESDLKILTQFKIQNNYFVNMLLKNLQMNNHYCTCQIKSQLTCMSNTFCAIRQNMIKYELMENISNIQLKKQSIKLLYKAFSCLKMLHLQQVKRRQNFSMSTQLLINNIKNGLYNKQYNGIFNPLFVNQISIDMIGIENYGIITKVNQKILIKLFNLWQLQTRKSLNGQLNAQLALKHNSVQRKVTFAM